MSQKASDIKRVLIGLSDSLEKVRSSVSDCKQTAKQLLQDSTRKRGNDVSLADMQAYLDVRFANYSRFKKARDESSSDKENGVNGQNLEEEPEQQRSLQPRFG